MSNIDSIIDRCLENIELISNDGKPVYFLITSTIKQPDDLSPYTTPNRFFDNFNITGCVVFTQSHAKALAESIDGVVENILVDVEKKIPIGRLIEDSSELVSTLIPIESGNISSEVLNTVKKSRIYKFKPNDLTANSVWSFLEYFIQDFSGKKAAIIGVGNIGSKLALSLVESGVNVSVCRRNQQKGITITQALNLIKPQSTISQVEYADSIEKACFKANIVIGATDGIPAIKTHHLYGCSRDVICIDVGKNSFALETVQFLNLHKIQIYRADVTPGIEGYIATLLKNRYILQNVCGRKTYHGIPLVSGGLLGRDGEMVVDSYNFPQTILGVADGKGDFKQEDALSENDIAHIKTLKEIIGAR